MTTPVGTTNARTQDEMEPLIKGPSAAGARGVEIASYVVSIDPALKKGYTGAIG